MTRIFGRAKILESIHVPELENCVSDHGTPTHGIYTFMQYQKLEGHDGSKWVPSKWPKNLDGFRDFPQPNRMGIANIVWDGYNPNLMLHIGLPKPPQWVLICVAIFGTLLQASVLGFAMWATR